jgi:hypothetical protein
MVKTRMQGYADKFNKAYNDALSNVGANYTYTTETKTFDSTGQESDVTVTSTTIFGDFQLIIDQRDLDRLGLQGTGNARFYTKKDYTIIPKAILTFNSEKWLFRRRIDDDYWFGGQVSQVWLLTKLDS